MSFFNENVLKGRPVKDPIQVGRTDVDEGADFEGVAIIPYASDPAGSYLYYECYPTVLLDAGIAVHTRLPQVNNPFDTLASDDINNQQLANNIATGINMKSQDQFKDIVQRMAHSRYWFRLWGQALRVKYQVPIPSIKVIGGQTAIPYDKNPQWAFNRIFPGGNYSGVLLWHAVWSLWYTIASPPTKDDVPAVDLSASAFRLQTQPKNMLAPHSPTDDNAVQSTGGVPL